MGTDNLFYKGVEKRATRKVEIRNKRTTTWLIVCEGTVTEKIILINLLNISINMVNMRLK